MDELDKHERTLDLRAGTLERLAEWTSPAGQKVRVHSRRLVSFTQRAVAAIAYEVEPLERPARLVVQSELVANEQLAGGVLLSDPRQGVATSRRLCSRRSITIEIWRYSWCTAPARADCGSPPGWTISSTVRRR